MDLRIYCMIKIFPFLSLFLEKYDSNMFLNYFFKINLSCMFKIFNEMIGKESFI